MAITKNPSGNLTSLLGENRFEYPKGIATTKGLQHFMVISELIFKPPIKNKDAFNAQMNFEQITSGNEASDYYIRGKSFVLHLPVGSLKTHYSADYSDVDLGIFGDILSQNAHQITKDLKENFETFSSGSGSGFIQKSMEFYGRMGKDVMQQASPYNSKGVRGDFANNIKFNITSALGALAPSHAKGEQVASMSMRESRNPYTSLIFTGVKKLRQHSFTFDFNPKSASESEALMKIITNLKVGMLPGLNQLSLDGSNVVEPEQEIVSYDPIGLDHHPGISKKKTTLKISNKMNSAFFSFPNTYRIQFYSNLEKNTYLHRIGNSFLTSLKAKYAPKFFEENGLPTSINLQLQFKENFTLDRSHAEDY